MQPPSPAQQPTSKFVSTVVSGINLLFFFFEGVAVSLAPHSPPVPAHWTVFLMILFGFSRQMNLFMYFLIHFNKRISGVDRVHDQQGTRNVRRLINTNGGSYSGYRDLLSGKCHFHEVSAPRIYLMMR